MSYKQRQALQVILKILHSGLYHVGPRAAQGALDIVEVWSFKDAHWSQWVTSYGGNAGEEPLNCIKKFVMPVIEKWLCQYWAELVSKSRTFTMKFRLEEMLKIEKMREDPNLGMTTYEERAASLPSPSMSPMKRKASVTPPEGGDKVDIYCRHCKSDECYKETCWKLNPDLKPAKRGNRAGKADQKRRARDQQYQQQRVREQQYQQQQNQQQQYYSGSADQQYRQQQYYQPEHKYMQQQSMSPSAAWSQSSPQRAQQSLPPGVTVHDMQVGGAAGGATGGGAPVPPTYQPPWTQQYGSAAAAPFKMPSFTALKDRECFSCGKKGHIAKNCPEK